MNILKLDSNRNSPGVRLASHSLEVLVKHVQILSRILQPILYQLPRPRHFKSEKFEIVSKLQQRSQITNPVEPQITDNLTIQLFFRKLTEQFLRFKSSGIVSVLFEAVKTCRVEIIESLSNQSVSSKYKILRLFEAAHLNR